MAAVLAASFLLRGETNVVDGVTYVCEDGVCRILEAAESAQPSAKGEVPSVLPPPARIVQGYRDEAAFAAFLEGGASEDPFAGKSLWIVLLLAVLGGLAMNLTPCVLPMAPVTLRVIGRSAANGAWYGLGIVTVYGALGIASALGGLAFGAIQANPWFNGAVALVFAALALSLGGVFAIDFSRHRTGRRGGAFLMGVLSALLAGACVAPILVSALLLTAKLYAEGRVAALALPFAVGFGLALPWPLLGAGLAVLPKPGAWMKWVNRAFAVLVLGFAVHYGMLSVRGFRGGQAPAEGGGRTLALDVAAFRARGLDGLRRPVLVDCGASWCRNCAAMERLMRDSPKVRAALARYSVVRLAAEDIAALRALPGCGEIRGLPAFLVYE